MKGPKSIHVDFIRKQRIYITFLKVALLSHFSEVIIARPPIILEIFNFVFPILL